MYIMLQLLNSLFMRGIGKRVTFKRGSRKKYEIRLLS